MRQLNIRVSASYGLPVLSALRRLITQSPWGGVDLSPYRCAAATSTTSAAATGSTASPTFAASSSPANAALPKVPIILRGRVEYVRGQSRNLVFLRLRQPPFDTVQVVCFGEEIASQAKAFTPESIVEVEGTLAPTKAPVTSTTCRHVELHASSLRVLSMAATPLPFPLHDSHTKLDTRLNHRTVDLRTPFSAAALRLVSAMCQSFRGALLRRSFMEMHSPKIVPCASEGGSAVFPVSYFDTTAYLAQSPQLYKQMALMGDAMRVFEVGPVFRAEKSLTHRHLTEFVGLDAEMVIVHSYTEVLDVLESVLCGVIHDVQTKHADLLQTALTALAQLRKVTNATAAQVGSALSTHTSVAAVNSDTIVYNVPAEVVTRYGIGRDASLAADGTLTTVVPSQDRYGARLGGGGADVDDAGMPRVLRLSFDKAAELLRAEDGGSGVDMNVTDDWSLPQERRLGQLIKARYSVDVYVIDQFHASARSFYTMPLSREAPQYTRSYDMYIRGEEVCSGSQREHDPVALTSRMRALGVDPEGLKDYVLSFRYGAWPHGGFGLGLERIAGFLLGAHDIRQVSMFPRDPKRLAP